MRRDLAALVPLLALSACATPQEPPGDGPADVTVELDAFSGLPNPVWTLSPAEAGEVAARLRDLPPGSGLLPVPVDPLGYRGFRIRNPGGEGGVAEEVYVFNMGGVGELRIGARGPIHRDARGLLRWLEERAEREGYGGVLLRPG